MPTADTVLGVVLAGGQSQRFGAPKALATLDGQHLIDIAFEQLIKACDAVAVSGMEWKEYPVVSDFPEPAMGPLGALNGALRYGVDAGFDRVMCCPVDVFPLPVDLPAILGTAPAVFDDQHLIGVWPVALQPALDAFLASGQRAFHAWIAESGARRVADPPSLININRPEDLVRAQALADAQRLPPLQPK